MKKFLLILILFALAGAVFAQNNGKLPTINTSSSKTAPKSKMPTINSAPADKPAPQTAKPVQKPVEKPVTAPVTETKTVESAEPAATEQPTEAPSLLKAAEAHKDNRDIEHKVLDNDESGTVEPQPAEPVTPSETDNATPAEPAAMDDNNVQPAVTPDDNPAAPEKSTNEPEQE